MFQLSTDDICKLSEDYSDYHKIVKTICIYLIQNLTSKIPKKGANLPITLVYK